METRITVWASITHAVDWWTSEASWAKAQKPLLQSGVFFYFFYAVKWWEKCGLACGSPCHYSSEAHTLFWESWDQKPVGCWALSGSSCHAGQSANSVKLLKFQLLFCLSEGQGNVHGLRPQSYPTIQLILLKHFYGICYNAENCEGGDWSRCCCVNGWRACLGSKHLALILTFTLSQISLPLITANSTPTKRFSGNTSLPVDTQSRRLHHTCLKEGVKSYILFT